MDIKGLASQEAVVCWRHVFREGNNVADALAKHSLAMDVGFQDFEDLPGFLSLCFLADAMSISFPRGF